MQLELLKTETEKKKQQVADQQAATGSKLSEYEKLLAQKEGEITDMAEFIKEKTDLLNQLIAKAAQEEAAARIRAAQQAAASMNTSGNIQQADSGISGGSVSLSDYEIMMLATIIYCEAGNQGTDGQLAVGYVIMTGFEARDSLIRWKGYSVSRNNSSRWVQGVLIWC